MKDEKKSDLNAVAVLKTTSEWKIRTAEGDANKASTEPAWCSDCKADPRFVRLCRLHAAASELLAALKQIEGLTRRDFADAKLDPVYATARKAIALVDDKTTAARK